VDGQQRREAYADRTQQRVRSWSLEHNLPSPFEYFITRLLRDVLEQS